MEKSKQAISNFISRDGKHKTSVDEEVRKAVTDEHVLPHQHEEVTTAIDKDVHQDHHHTTIQPITARETLSEQHVHNIIPVEHKTYQHGNEKDLQETLDREASQYMDTAVTHDTTHSSSVAPTVQGERTHHHVHEHIQPVIQKETVAPQIVHTTIPVHETHHAQAMHHGTSTLPAKTLDEFKAGGGELFGRNTANVTEFEGCPKAYNKGLQTEQLEGDNSMHMNSQEPATGNVTGMEKTTSQSEGDDNSGSYALGGGESTNVFGGQASDKAEPRVDPDMGRSTTSGSRKSDELRESKGSLVDKLVHKKGKIKNSRQES